MVSLNSRKELECKTNGKIYLICYIGLFFLLWTLYVSIVLPVVKNSPFYFYDIFKLLIWTLPVFMFLKYEKVDALSYLKLKSNGKKCIKWATLISLAFIGYQIIGCLVVSQEVKFNPFFDVDKWIKGVILVGFIEEILFRGFFLQRIASYTRFGFANIITSILFLLIHFPGWFALNEFPPGTFLKIALFAFVFIFSIVQGYVLKKTESLWVCIVIHSINNFMSYSLGA